MSMTIRPTATVYTPPARPAAPVPSATVVTPMPTVVRNDVMGNSLEDMKDVVRAAMQGGELARPSGLKSAALGLIRKGQSAVDGLMKALRPDAASNVGVAQTTQPLTPIEKAKKIGQAAVTFALPVAGAAGVAAGLGWLVGPLVPIVGSHALGAVAGALAVGHTTGFLMHGGMRLPWVDREQKEINSAGATVGSAAIGAGLAAIIGSAAGATVGLPLLATGAIVGAAPRLIEWAIARL